MVTGELAFHRGYPCGRTSTFDQAIPVNEIATRLQDVCREEVQLWANGCDLIERMAVVAGGA